MKALFLTVVMFVMGSVAFAESLDVLKPVHSSIKRSLEAASVFLHSVDSTGVESRQIAFRAALADVAAGLDVKAAAVCREREGDSIEYKIACIALDLKSRPHLYQQIYQEYLNAPLPPPERIGAGGPDFPPLNPAHVKEAYRLVWEYMLLWPEQSPLNFRGLGEFHQGIALRALGEINSVKSQVLYAVLLHGECETRPLRTRADERDYALDTVAGYNGLTANARKRSADAALLGIT